MMKHIFFTFLLLLASFVCSGQNQAEPNNINRNVDYSGPVHSLGVAWHSAWAPAPQLRNATGEIAPRIFQTHTPEILLHYTCTFPNHFGFTMELPFGKFQRQAEYDLSKYNTGNVHVIVGSFYIGFAPKLTYMRPLGDKCNIQAEVGLKFMPFIYPASHWNNTMEDYVSIDGVDNPNYAITTLEVSEQAYRIPDATAAVMFFFHGKKHTKNNFSIGIYANLSFVERMTISYDTTLGDLPVGSVSYGKCGWKSSTIGIAVGYRFLGLRP